MIVAKGEIVGEGVSFQDARGGDKNIYSIPFPENSIIEIQESWWFPQRDSWEDKN